MLKSISLNHYKAFETASVDIRPITILLGANSVGKSSIIQLFLMLQQTGKAGLKSYKSALKLYGGYVNLGDATNLFRKKKTDSPLTISFTLTNKSLKNYLTNEYNDSFNRLFQMIPMFFPLKGFAELRDRPYQTKTEFSDYLDAIINVLSKSTLKVDYRKEIGRFIRQRNELSFPQLTKENKSEFLEGFEFLQGFSKKIKNDTFQITYQLILNPSNNLEVSKFSIRQDNLIIIELNRKENFKIISDIIKIDERVNMETKELFLVDNTIFNSFLPLEYDGSTAVSLKTSIVVQVVNVFQNELRELFSEDSINYVSPLRAHPKRYYMLDKAKVNLTLDTLDGDAITEVLKDNKSITKSVNQWLKNFGVEVDVQGFKEVIHHLVVKQNNIDLDITDVGFGISQILPVIIQGFLSPKNSTTIIEQPEIHLHPKMQADLADLFIDIVNNSKGKKLIIETHSEYLLKRLRRRISEKKILADQVSICLFNPQTKDKGATIDTLEIEEKGFFEWPVDFYGGEILKDTTEFLKNQG